MIHAKNSLKRRNSGEREFRETKEPFRKRFSFPIVCNGFFEILATMNVAAFFVRVVCAFHVVCSAVRFCYFSVKTNNDSCTFEYKYD